MITRGGNSLRAGRLYEAIINNLLKNKRINNVKLVVNEFTAGAGKGKDIVFKCGDLELSIEVKNGGAFEGGGKTLKHNGHSWVINDECFLKDIVGAANPYGGIIPECFATKSLSTWNKEKSRFGDVYISKHNTIISEYYRAKGCNYIQIKGKGLYHTGSDPLNLGVPFFSVSTMLRIRVTKHKKKGVPTDVTAALVFKRKDLVKSTYCLETKLPPIMQEEE
jgi:hypothetical protein